MSTEQTKPTAEPSQSQSHEPRETMIYVTNKQWECRVQEGSPYLENGYIKAIKGDDNPHHWGSKKFQVYDAPGPGLIEVKVGDPAVRFWAHTKNEDKKLTLYWGCRKKDGNRIVWWVFAPNGNDERINARGQDLWGWELVTKFYAKSKVDSWVCENCTFLNTRVEDECEMCHTLPPPERKSTPIAGRALARLPRQQVVTRSTSIDSDNDNNAFKYGWWICSTCSGENPPSMSVCDFCGKEEYNPKIKPEGEDLSKKNYIKGSSESFGVPVPSSSPSTSNR